MLSFLGKVFLFLGAAFSLGALAVRRAGDRGPASRPAGRQPGATPHAAAAPAAEPAQATAPAASPPPDGMPAQANKADKSGSPLPASGARKAAARPAAPPRDDPLAAKHRAAAFDHDFRTLDYGHLSQDEIAREKVRRQRQHSSWHPKGPGSHEPLPPLQNAQFAQFGGSFVTAEIVRGRSTERVPDLMPSLPGDSELPASAADHRPLTGPDPRGPTPKREQRTLLPEDPLAAKHRAAPFDEDFRTLDYRKLGSPRPLASLSGPAPNDLSETAHDAVADEAAIIPSQAAFRTAGAAGPLPGADVGSHADTAAGEAALAEEVMVREPERLDAPRADTPDDLTRIDGIGPSLERMLFENGIYHFDQIARWGAGEAHWFEARSGFPGRVSRERWVEQAQALVSDRATPRTAV